MSSLYLGFYIDQETKSLYEVLVAGEDKKEAYKTYIEYFNEIASDIIVSNFLEILPIEKFHYNNDLENLEGSLISQLILTEYPRVYFEGNVCEDENKFDEVLSNDYIDNNEG